MGKGTRISLFLLIFGFRFSLSFSPFLNLLLLLLLGEGRPVGVFVTYRFASLPFFSLEPNSIIVFNFGLAIIISTTSFYIGGGGGPGQGAGAGAGNPCQGVQNA
ncbi:hypothetical protein QBC33DRAFT_541279 [Phialemonium atrogriseum]|uniref:Uncharacterized protein n=1 Tax=Phialemonium atrogriseum TaxID=1093897 RepID=A0AAJ0FKL9_9PEZI|nr:uncharacterized protein QBC33DRAFT_541279 [Phialemonium atrogriseum]KAK1766513.1 hypothetical protein QBC33DRAFT_541279 [Phialemonium atrogriseum]